MAENNGSGRWLSPQEALAAGLVDRIIEPAATEKTPAAQATPAGQWRKLLGKLGLVRPADALPPDRNILHFGDPEKGSGPRTSDTLRKTATPEPIPFVRTTHSITKNQIIL